MIKENVHAYDDREYSLPMNANQIKYKKITKCYTWCFLQNETNFEFYIKQLLSTTRPP